MTKILGGLFNDLWRYNITSGMWAWVGGTNLDSDLGIYTSFGADSNISVPAGRYSMASWYNPSTHEFYLFGGTASKTIENSMVANDFWRYKIDQNLWAWLGGFVNQSKILLYLLKINYYSRFRNIWH